MLQFLEINLPEHILSLERVIYWWKYESKYYKKFL